MTYSYGNGVFTGRMWDNGGEAALARGIKVILLTPTHDLLTLRRGEPKWATELPKHATQVRQLAVET